MTFYEKVKAEICFSDERHKRYGLCKRSKTFKEYYAEYEKREKIIKHAFLFQRSKHRDDGVLVDGRCYTCFKDYYLFGNTKERFFEIRLEFIDWCIENNLDL